MTMDITSSDRAHKEAVACASISTPSHDLTISIDGNDNIIDGMHLPSDGSQEATLPGVYSQFSVSQKKAIIFAGSFIAMVSYMSSSIFYPAVNQASNASVVSIEWF